MPQIRNSVDFHKLLKKDDLGKKYVDKKIYLANPGDGKFYHYELDFEVNPKDKNGTLVCVSEEDAQVMINSYRDEVAIERIMERAALGDVSGLYVSNPLVDVPEGMDFNPDANVQEILTKYGISEDAYQQAVKAQSVGEYLDILLKSKTVNEGDNANE